MTLPDKGILLPAKHADRTQMGDLIDIDSDAIHLFDRDYIDYKQFDHLCLHDVRFITRLKKNAQVKVLSEQIPQAGSPIVKDQEVFLGNSQNGTKMTHSLPTRFSKGRRKQNWEEEFRVIKHLFAEGEVSHLDDLTYAPMFN